jgi:hypothetical protein
MKHDGPHDALERALVFVTGDDWEGIYVEGLLIKQGHSITVLDALMVGADNPSLKRVQKEANIDWLNDVGELPEQIRDVVWADDFYDKDSGWMDPNELQPA